MLKKFFIILHIFIFIQIANAHDMIIVEDYLDISNLYEMNGDYSKALEYIRVIESVEPYNPQIKYKKSLLLKNLGQPKESLEAFLLALKLEPQYENSQLYEEFCAPKTETINELENVDKSEINEFQPQEIVYNSEYYNNEGKKLYSEGEIDTATHYFKKAVKLDKKNKIALNNLGMIYWQNYEIKTAIKYFLKAYKIDSTYTQPLINLSLLYKQQKDSINQLKYLQIALENNKDDYCVYYLLGNYYYQKGQYKKAIDYYANSLTKNEKFIESYIALGTILFETEDYEKAYEVLTKAIDEGLYSDKIYFLLSRTALLLNKTDEAKINIEKAIIYCKNPKYMLELAKINMLNENYEAALQLFKENKSAGSEEEILNYIGLCEYKSGNIKEAISYFKKAILLNDAKAVYYYNLALCYKSLKEKKLYVKYLQKTFAITPIKPQDYIDFSYIYKDYGNFSLAHQFLSNGIEKFPNEKKLYYAKLKLYEEAQDKEKYDNFKQFFQKKFFNVE